MDKIVSRKPPGVRQSSLSWHLSRLLLPRLKLLNGMGGWITIWDSFGTPGDTVLTSTVCREIRVRFPRIKINCVTPNPELLELDPAIDVLNAAPTLILLRVWYLDIIQRKNGAENILAPTLRQAGVVDYRYQARMYLSDEELEAGRRLVSGLKKPIITLNVQSREKVKMWLEERWVGVVQALSQDYDIVHLGAEDEPQLPGVTRFAGRLTMRESAAVLACAKMHLGVVSFLMHVASGLNIPAVIIYGGRETPDNSGYSGNVNLYSKTECSPCWLHDSHGETCPYEMICMQWITESDVLRAIGQLSAKSSPLAGAA